MKYVYIIISIIEFVLAILLFTNTFTANNIVEGLLFLDIGIEYVLLARNY